MTVVAYQGEAGAYSEEGARALFPGAEHQPLPSIRTVFEAVEVGRVQWGLVPMDNSQAGSINETYDLFLRHGLHLVGETIVRVEHCLLALPGTAIDDVHEVISHPQAIAQCEEFLSALEANVRAEYNTAGAAKKIAEGSSKGSRRSRRDAQASSTGSRRSPSGSRPTPTTRRASARSPATRRRSPSRTSRRWCSVSGTSRARSTAVSARSPSVTST